MNLLILPTMNLTFDESHPLFNEVLKGVRDIVSAINYGVKYDYSSVEVQEPTGEYITILRQDWMMELEPALAFFEHVEYYEECAQVQQLIQKLSSAPSISDIIESVKDAHSSSHDS